VVADAAYAGKELRKLPACVTWTTRLRKDAALHELPPPRTGRRGRPSVKGARLPALAALAAAASFTPVTVTRYRKTATVQAAAVTCLWYSASGSRPVQVILVRARARARTGYDIALVTTDLDASPAAVIERYAARWSVEVAIEDAKAGLRRRANPQPHRPRGPGHRPLHLDLPVPGHRLVRHRRTRPRRRR
jgi:Transposase DDE domain